MFPMMRKHSPSCARIRQHPPGFVWVPPGNSAAKTARNAANMARKNVRFQSLSANPQSTSHRSARYRITVLERVWAVLARGFPRIPSDSRGFPRIPTDSLGFPRISQDSLDDSLGFPGIPYNSYGFYVFRISFGTELLS